MTDSLLLVSLGPVQEFIASARRCQDLWFGSWLLSELSRVTAKVIEERCGVGALVFPGSLEVGGGADDKPAVANKILAVVPAGMSVQLVADAGRERMTETLRSLATDAFSKIPPTAYFDDELRSRAFRQIDDLMDYAWVAVPLSSPADGRAGYAQARDQAERLLAARKNRRTWTQVALARDGGWGDAVPKSSLDGLRESVLHEALYDALNGRRRDGFPALKPDEAHERYFVRKQERLCGVGLLKRVGCSSFMTVDDSAADHDFTRRRRGLGIGSGGAAPA